MKAKPYGGNDAAIVCLCECQTDQAGSRFTNRPPPGVARVAWHVGLIRTIAWYGGEGRLNSSVRHSGQPMWRKTVEDATSSLFIRSKFKQNTPMTYDGVACSSPSSPPPQVPAGHRWGTHPARALRGQREEKGELGWVVCTYSVGVGDQATDLK